MIFRNVRSLFYSSVLSAAIALVPTVSHANLTFTVSGGSESLFTYKTKLRRQDIPVSNVSGENVKYSIMVALPYTKADGKLAYFLPYQKNLSSEISQLFRAVKVAGSATKNKGSRKAGVKKIRLGPDLAVLSRSGKRPKGRVRSSSTTIKLAINKSALSSLPSAMYYMSLVSEKVLSKGTAQDLSALAKPKTDDAPTLEFKLDAADERKMPFVVETILPTKAEGEIAVKNVSYSRANKNLNVTLKVVSASKSIIGSINVKRKNKVVGTVDVAILNSVVTGIDEVTYKVNLTGYISSGQDLSFEFVQGDDKVELKQI